jgi:hypothetical protein
MPLTRRQLLATPLALWVAPSGAAEALPRNVILYGKEDPLPNAITLRAGPVTALFEPELAFLRYIRYGDAEILRGIYCAVRDKVWGTVAPKVSNVLLEARSDSFRLTFDVSNVEGDIDFGWRGVILGDARGSIRFEFNGKARSTFLKNRLGFAVLHPIDECAGKKAYIEHDGGRKEEGLFPDAIAPNQPFLDLRAISHEVAPGVLAEVRFEGEVFETEDHRNWTDCNYKTYCTPLAKPYPVEVSKGAGVRQAITIQLRNAKPVPLARRLEIEMEAAKASPVKLPSIGTALALDQPAPTAQELARLRSAGIRHLRVDLKLFEDSWKSNWDRAVATGFPLEAAVFLSNDAEAELRQLASRQARMARWLIFHKDENSTSEKWIVLARKYLKGAPIGSGTNVFFTELNRERPPLAAIDFACYSLTPQVHAFDNMSLVENLEGQAHTVRGGHKFLQGKPIAVTPVTFKQRFNPQAKGAPEPVVAGRLPSRIDPRQMSLFGAAWTLGSIKHLAENNVASISYYETHGWAGLMETAAGSPQPALFRSTPGSVFPLYHVLAAVNEFWGGEVLPINSAEPLRACALALRNGRRKRVLVANLTPELQQVVVDASLLSPRPRVRFLDEHSFQAAANSPESFHRASGSVIELVDGRLRISLLPYGTARIDA